MNDSIENASESSKNRFDKFVFLRIVPPTIIFVALVWFAASGVRGTDQYWYVADVEKLIQGGPRTTNNIYPAQIISPKAHMPYPFMHNILNLYLVLPAAACLGSFRGWVVANIVASIFTALIVAWLVARLASRTASVLAYTVYLLLPLTVWQTAQPLAEATIAPFVAIGLIAYVHARNNQMLWVLVMAAGCAAYLCRVSFFPLLFIIPVSYLVQNKLLRANKIFSTLALLALAALAVIIRKTILVQGMPLSLDKILTNAIPGVTRNMNFLFALTPKQIRLGELCLKAAVYLKYQLLPPHSTLQIFYLPFNVLAAGSIGLCFTRRLNAQARVGRCALLLLALHAVTIVLHQNQFRYLLPITPAVLAAGTLTLHKTILLKRNWTCPKVLVPTLMLLALFDIPLAAKLHREGLREKQLCTILDSTFDRTVPQDQAIIVDATKTYNLLLGYVLRPRQVVFVRSDYKKEQYTMIVRKSNPKWLLCPHNSPLLQQFQIVHPSILEDFPPPYEDYALFRL